MKVVVAQLRIAKEKGVYPNPRAGMQDLITQGYRGVHKVEFVSAGPNSYNGGLPHVWFVSASVWADSYDDGSQLHPDGYDNPGSFFLRVRQGWVHMPEGAFPVLIGLAMDVFGLEGR